MLRLVYKYRVYSVKSRHYSRRTCNFSIEHVLEAVGIGLGLGSGLVSGDCKPLYIINYLGYIYADGDFSP